MVAGPGTARTTRRNAIPSNGIGLRDNNNCELRKFPETSGIFAFPEYSVTRVITRNEPLALFDLVPGNRVTPVRGRTDTFVGERLGFVPFDPSSRARIATERNGKSLRPFMAYENDYVARRARFFRAIDDDDATLSPMETRRTRIRATPYESLDSGEIVIRRDEKREKTSV